MLMTWLTIPLLVVEHENVILQAYSTGFLRYRTGAGFSDRVHELVTEIGYSSWVIR